MLTHAERRIRSLGGYENEKWPCRTPANDTRKHWDKDEAHQVRPIKAARIKENLKHARVHRTEEEAAARGKKGRKGRRRLL